MTDPISWGQDLLAKNSPCLFDFKLFVEELRKQYGDKERVLTTGSRNFTEFRQGHFDKNETVRAYANRLHKMWRDSNLDETKHFTPFYYQVWVGLRLELHPKIKPFTPKSGMFDTLNALFDRAADVETKLNQEQQRPPESSRWQKGDQKRNFRPSISEPTQTKPEDSGSGSGSRSNDRRRTDLPPAPWVAAEIYGKWKAVGKCLRCGGGHRAHKCTKYSHAHLPDKLHPNSGAQGDRQVKRQRSFETQKPKN
jgi:hypothetical protein